MADFSLAERRDLILETVLKPLDEAGLRKRRGVSREEHQSGLVALAERLAFLSVEWHEALGDTIEHNAKPGPDGKRGVPRYYIWPDEVSILQWARRLSPLGDMPKLVGTFMRSRAGRDAWARGPFVASALHKYLVTVRRPPELDRSGWDILERQAADVEDRWKRTSAREQAGEASERELEALQAWEEKKIWLKQLIDGDLDRCHRLAS